MALEDAAALAEFVSSIGKTEDLGPTMKAFQAFRQPRVEIMRKMAYGNQNMFTMEDGPQQVQRDRAWAAMTEKARKEFELGEEHFKAKQKVEAVPGTDMRTPEGRMWMYGYDVFTEAQAFLKGRR